MSLFDLHGNAWEWCQIDWELFDLQQRPRPLRGGAFFINAVNVRSAYRVQDWPEHRDGNVGFRPARTFR